MSQAKTSTELAGGAIIGRTVLAGWRPHRITGMSCPNGLNGFSMTTKPWTLNDLLTATLRWLAQRVDALASLVQVKP